MLLNEIDKAVIASPSDLESCGEHLGSLSRTSGPMLFRGQPGTFNNLMPALGREIPSGAYSLFVRLERQLIANFRQHYADLGPTLNGLPSADEVAKQPDIDTLALMQHYDVPSRLLDWSKSVWIAAYFACVSNPTNDGALWFLDRSLLNVISDDLAVADIQSRISVSIGNQPGQYHPSWGGPLLAVIEPKVNARLNAQQGCLTASDNATVDHAQIIWRLATQRHGGERTGNSFGRYIIRAERKRDMLRFLAREKEVDAKSLFPDIVGLSRFVRTEFEALRNEYF